MHSEEHILTQIIATLPEGKPEQICIGLHWTAVVMDVDGALRCGLASTLRSDHQHGTDVPQAGELQEFTGLALANLVHAESSTLVSVGMAAINALMPQQPDTWQELNAEHVIAAAGAGQAVALVGHFPFVERLRERVGQLTVLELNPRPGDVPSSMAAEVIPQAAVVAITGMSLLNRTFDQLLSLCNPQAQVILLGPSVPLSPLLFERGVDILSGSIVNNIDSVLRVVAQGGNFRQVHRAGVRLVTISQAEG
ncbi:MAG: DUF364 domain-containing protein [Anaerolineales bacterium]|nr:DUF364 domain-containing protein [Anaerolineales bacterium]